MNNKFFIGQISKLYSIPIKTLRYYDEIGLFEPMYVDNKSGYRYYSTEQFEQLHTIIYLKIMGIPLKDIKNYLEIRDIDCFVTLLKEQQMITKNKINEFRKIENIIENRIKEVEESKAIFNIKTVTIKELKERKILKLAEKFNTQSEFELCIKKLKNSANIPNHIIIIGNVGLTISKDNIMKGIFDEYNSVFVLLEDNVDNFPFVDKIEQGHYACFYFRGMRREARNYYKEIFEYIDRNGLEIIGDSIEREIINQFISDDKSYHLTEIQIPIKKH